jgi:hypothetical protein
MDYFSLCYGEKYIAFLKLVLISKLIAVKDAASMSLAVCLVYSLAVTGTSRVLSLMDQLAAMGLPSTVSPLPNFADNTVPMSIPFIIGFILGDGSMLIRLRQAATNVWIIPLVLLPQKNTPVNVSFLTMVMQYLASLNIQSALRYSSGMVILELTGISSVFLGFLPLCLPFSRYFFWKLPHFQELMAVSRLVLANAHSTLYGMIKTISILFDYLRSRDHSLSYWVEIATKLFADKGAKNASGEYMIKVVNGRKGAEKGKPIAWKVDFAENCKVDPHGHLANAQFRFYSDADKSAALVKAVLHRDNHIKLWVDSLLGSLVLRILKKKLFFLSFPHNFI